MPCVCEDESQLEDKSIENLNSIKLYTYFNKHMAKKRITFDQSLYVIKNLAKAFKMCLNPKITENN